MNSIAQGNALGINALNNPPCKGKSIIFGWVNTKTFALSGRKANELLTQGVALGYVEHWAFSPSLLNPKLEIVITVRWN